MEAVLTEEALERWGRRIGAEARTPLVIALRGDLGAGKSTLARAIARGAGVEGDVPSPTFNLVFRYETPRGLALHHFVIGCGVVRLAHITIPVGSPGKHVHQALPRLHDVFRAGCARQSGLLASKT